MKKIFLFTFLITLTACLVFAQDYDIRKLKWGMAFDDVKSAEDLGDDFFKTEEIMGIDVNINFGFDYRGLYSVIYSTRDKDFMTKVGDVLRKKYGNPKTGLDFSFLVQSKSLLKKYPEAVVNLYEKGNEAALEKIKNSDERKLIKTILTRRNMWTYGNTWVLLLDTPEVTVLSYWFKDHQLESKTKFVELIEELKKKVKKEKTKKAKEADKF
jgi:hypothetical protein